MAISREQLWNEYVTEQLTDEEVKEGNPTVDGLRRVIEEVYSTVSEQNGKRKKQVPSVLILLRKELSKRGYDYDSLNVYNVNGSLRVTCSSPDKDHEPLVAYTKGNAIWVKDK